MELNSKLKICVLTHKDDLDGWFCAKLIQMAYGAPDDNIEVRYATYEDLTENIIALYNDRKQFNRIFITDLSIDTTQPRFSCIRTMLTEVCEERNTYVIDHHMYSTKALKNIKPAKGNVIVAQLMDADTGYRTSATLLLYRFLKDYEETANKLKTYNQEIMEMLITAISDWDSWAWATTGNTFAKELQKYYCSKTPQEAVDELASYCSLSSTPITDVQQKCISQITEYQDAYDTFKKHIEHTARFIKCKGFKVAIFQLPDTIKQEYKALFVEEMLRENNIFDVDFFIMGDANILRVYCNTKPLNTILKPAGLGFNNSGRTYLALPISRVAENLKCEVDRNWEYYFDKIQYNLESI